MSPPRDDEEAGRDRRWKQMQPALAGLLAEVLTGGMSADGFDDRLAHIHDVHLGPDAAAPEARAARRQAAKAVAGLARDAPSRHHQVEALSEALGIDKPGSRT